MENSRPEECDPASEQAPRETTQRRWPRLGGAVAVSLALLTYGLLPSVTPEALEQGAFGLTHAGRVVAATGVLMGLLWLTEALPVAVTALLPIALVPLLTAGELSIRSVAAPYANELIYLYMGGFLMALAMQRWGLHERLALTVVSLVGSRPDRLVLGFMLATAGLSMWISNTATVVMMLPIALSVVELVRRQSRAEGSAAASDEPGARSDFAICLLLGLAYSASIGGMATLIGTPPNLMLSAFVADRYDMDLTMSAWLPLGLTLVVILLPLTWFLLVRVLYPVGREAARGSGDLIRQRLTDLGTMTRPERRVLVVFVSAALLWIFRGRLTAIELFGGQPLAGLTDPGIAVLASIFLFALPAGKASEGERETPYEPLLTWRGALALPWGILLLFGGGLSLAWCIVAASVDVFIGQAISYLDWIPPLAFIALVAAVVLFLTEITSNTATTATFLPIVAAAADGLGMSPLELLVPMTLAASCAFMMPVATPPNAIVFGSGEITIPQMCRAGIWLNLIALVVIMVVTQLVPLGGI